MLRALEQQAGQRYQEEWLQFQAESLVGDERKRMMKRELRRSLRDGEEAQQLAADWIHDQTEPPARRRYLTNDSTVEKLGELLNQNPNGVLCYRDELTGLLIDKALLIAKPSSKAGWTKRGVAAVEADG